MDHLSPQNSNEIIRMNSDDQDLSDEGLDLGKSKNLNRVASIDRYADDEDDDGEDIDEAMDQIDTAIQTLKELIETNELKKSSLSEFTDTLEDPQLEPYVQKSDTVSQLYQTVKSMQHEKDKQARQELKDHLTD